MAVASRLRRLETFPTSTLAAKPCLLDPRLSQTHFFSTSRAREHAIYCTIDGIMIVICAETYILAKSTKLSQLELLFWLKYVPDRLSAGASPQTPLGKLTVLPNTKAAFRGLRLRRGG